MLKVDTYMWFPGWSWGHWPPLHTWHKLLPCILCLGSVPPAPLHSQSLPLSPAETHTHTQHEGMHFWQKAMVGCYLFIPSNLSVAVFLHLSLCPSSTLLSGQAEH